LGAKDALFIALQELTDKDTIQYIKKFSNKLDFQTLIHDESFLPDGSSTYICSLIATDIEILETMGALSPDADGKLHIVEAEELASFSSIYITNIETPRFPLLKLSLPIPCTTTAVLNASIKK
jgi:hypothetical protein